MLICPVAFASFNDVNRACLSDAVGKDLVLNTQKISDRNSAKEALEQKRRDEVSARNTAITKLKALGLTDEEILAITK